MREPIRAAIINSDRCAAEGYAVRAEAHLRQILTSYASYYNESRTHLSLHKDAPLGRAVQRYGNIAATPVLSGLHHRYARI
jgi:hypothetical protein